MRAISAWILGIGALALACASPVDTGDTWLLAGATTSDFAPTGLVFRNVETDERYKIGFRRKQIGIVAVPAGRYVLHRVDSHYDNALPARFGSAATEFEVEAGEVNEWGVLRMDKTRERTGKWWFDISVIHHPEIVPWAHERYPQIMERAPVRRIPHGIELAFQSVADRAQAAMECAERGDRYAEVVMNELVDPWGARLEPPGEASVRIRLRVNAAGEPYDVTIQDASSPAAEAALRDAVGAIVLPAPPDEEDCAIADEPINLQFEARF